MKRIVNSAVGAVQALHIGFAYRLCYSLYATSYMQDRDVCPVSHALIKLMYGMIEFLDHFRPYV